MTGLYWDEDGEQEGLLTRRSPEHCLTGQEIEDYLFNRLSGVTREAVEEHLLMCAECQKRVEEEERYIDAVRAAAGRLEAETLAGVSISPEEHDSRPKRGGVRRWAVAAGLVAVLAGGSLTIRMLQPQPRLDVPLRVERSADSIPGAVPTGRDLLLRPDLRGLPPLPVLRWTIVDRSGVVVKEGVVEPQAETAQIFVDRGLPEGRYWVRLLDPETGILLREYSLHLRGR